MPTNSEFDAVYLDRSMSVERQQSNLGKAGEPHGQVSPYAPETPAVATDSYPNVFGYSYQENNSQFSRDKNWEPQAMADEASGSGFADTAHFLNNSPYTAGSRVCHELNERWKSPHDAASGAGDGKTGPA